MFSFLRRALFASPTYTVVACGMLALGIGAATSIYSVLHALLLKPLRYGDPDRIVLVQLQHPTQGSRVFAPAEFVDLQGGTAAFAALAAQTYDYVNLTKTAAPARLTGVKATADYFAVFGVEPRLGRTWLPEETLAGANPVVVLSEKLWRQQFAADPRLAGQTITLDDVPHTVIGVMPAGFSDPWGNASLWRPIAMNGPSLQDRQSHYFATFARLAPNTDPAGLPTQLTPLAAQFGAAYPTSFGGWDFLVTPLAGMVVSDYRAGLLALGGAVLCLLLLTCANVAGLALVRASSRRREFAIRAALGASRGRLVRTALAESVVLAVVGGGLGLLLANWGISAIVWIVGSGWLPRLDEIAINRPVLFVSVALTLLTGLLFGLAPALGASRTRAEEALREAGTRGSAGPGARRLRQGLVVAEIALAIMLLIAFGILARSFRATLGQPTGLAADQLLAVGLSLSATNYGTADLRRGFYADVERAVAALPGVQGVAFTQTLPFNWGIPFTLVPDGPSALNPASPPFAFYDSVSDDYFAAAGIPLLSGRSFNAFDTPDRPSVVIINQSAARRYFGHGEAVGRFLRPNDPTSQSRLEIVGVVGDVARTGLGVADTPLQVYRPLRQRPTEFATLLVRTAADPASRAAEVRRAIWSVDGDQALGFVRPLQEFVDDSTSQPRLYFTVFGTFAGLAWLLAVVGLYGVIAYGVNLRLREFGIRCALGADAQRIRTLVLWQSLRLITAGIAIGLIGATLCSPYLAGLLYGVSTRDATVYTLVPFGLGLAALAACLLPANRAARTDPAIALRAE